MLAGGRDPAPYLHAQAEDDQRVPPHRLLCGNRAGPQQGPNGPHNTTQCVLSLFVQCERARRSERARWASGGASSRRSMP